MGAASGMMHRMPVSGRTVRRLDVKRARCLVTGLGLAVAMLAATPAAAALRGLIIGIDQYPNFGPQNRLSGAVNDARDMPRPSPRRALTTSPCW